ncbi:MAG: ABC-F family ATP-binding cassette domain-containing protein [Methyloligellaceae bacterium]
MLHINDITYRIEGRLLLEKATTAIPSGHKVGIVGRNGTGKTTLLRLISSEIAPEDGEIKTPNNTRIVHVAQEAQATDKTLLETVLEADAERHNLLAEAETATDPHRIAEIQIRLTDIDAHSAPARAAAILAGLGFDETAQQRTCEEFSGGWRMRVSLASALFTEPDVLLLDEPNNYLDLEGTLWLENFLRGYRNTVIIVSHDRDLLNKAVTGILHLHQHRLNYYSGGYDQFEDTRREKQRLELKLMKKQDDERRKLEAFVTRFKAKASKAAQAQSRVKALAKMQPIAAQIDDAVIPFHFPTPEKDLGNPLMRLENVSVGYTPDNPVLRDLSLRIDSDDRIGLLGSNGNGKSTFAKLLAGWLDAETGHKRQSKKLEIGYFTQHQLDDLNPKHSPYDHIAELMEDATEAQKRAKLGQLGFGADKADTPAGQLSGGEKARLLFAMCSFHGPHILILDEPTNHLDVDSCEALIHAINSYEGAIVLISHDRHLIQACADRLWVVRNGTVLPYEGDIDDYRNECLSDRSNKTQKSKKPDGNGKDASNRQDQRRAAAARRAELAPLRKITQKLEKDVDKITQQITKVDEQLSDTSLYEKDPDKVQKLTMQRGQLTKDLSAAEEKWMEALEEYEMAEAGE